MTALDLLVASITGAAGGGVVYLLVDRSSEARYSAERWLALAVPALIVPALGTRFGFWSPVHAVYGIFVLVLVGVTIFDFRKQEIPLWVTLPGAAAGLALGATLLPFGFARALTGSLFGGGVLIAATLIEAARKKEVGGGDWKYAAMIGAFLGWPAILTALVLTGIIGVVGGLVLRMAGVASGPQALGPWLSAGATGAILLG